ncbi:MAG: polyprenyl synthetase family protein [Clostridiales bacterium]|nr:polyprenyl synthetase family protein [Clostridiales bacterium]
MEKILLEYRNLINKELEKNIAPEKPEILFEAMRYSVFAGGKRARPLFMMAVCDSLGGNIKQCLPFAAAIEMIHTYSLIHDDLPAMDNDDYRRGKLTNHKVYGEAMAILAGDALLNRAFEIIAEECCNNLNIGNMYAFRYLTVAAGACGMIGGQAADILSEGQDIDMREILFIHKKKTSALFCAALNMGAALAGAGIDKIKRITALGEKIGLAFQIRDDILDITSTQEILGKPVNSDMRNKKNTYVSLFGMEKTNGDYKILSAQIYSEIKNIFGDNNILYYLVSKILDRDK